MYHQVYRSKFYIFRIQHISVTFTDLITNSGYRSAPHYIIGFCPEGGVRLLRGTP
jgi:hypothetical protein